LTWKPKPASHIVQHVLAKSAVNEGIASNLPLISTIWLRLGKTTCVVYGTIYRTMLDHGLRLGDAAKNIIAVFSVLIDLDRDSFLMLSISKVYP